MKTRKDRTQRLEVCHRMGDTPAETMWDLIGVVVSAALAGGLPRKRCEAILEDLRSGIASLDGGGCGTDGCAGRIDLDDVSRALFSRVESLAERNRELYAGRAGT